MVDGLIKSIYQLSNDIHLISLKTENLTKISDDIFFNSFDWIGLFDGISTFVDYLMPKSSLKKHSSSSSSSIWPLTGGGGEGALNFPH